MHSVTLNISSIKKFQSRHLPNLITIWSITNQPEFSHVRSCTTIGATSYPYNNGFIILEANLKKMTRDFPSTSIIVLRLETENETIPVSTHDISVFPEIKSYTFSNTARTRLRMSGIPRSASAIAKGQSGKAGHAIAVTLRGSTYLGCCSKNGW